MRFCFQSGSIASYHEDMANLENHDRKILVVDDDPQSLKLVEKALQFEGYQVESADSGSAALQKMNSWSPHLVLLDVSMPGLSGIQTLQLLRTKGEYVSVLFLSGKSNTDDIIRGLDAGADDYVCKPFDILELLARVRSQLRIKDLNDSLKRANTRLKELVDIDDLTGLFNMRSLYTKLDFEINRARRYKRHVCVLMMDMDFFKKCNDDHDHLFGSYVLGQVGRLVRENIRKVDFAARYGGDEFLLVLTEIDRQGALTFAERLRVLIESTVFANDLHMIKLTASFGLAIKEPHAVSVDARSLVRYADKGLYLAKQQGRNRVVEYDYEQETPSETHAPTVELRRRA
jgi:diguanylate cyclase (GGDEF)-like protein